MKKCPYCAEEIQDEAVKCKHCGERLSYVECIYCEKEIIKDAEKCEYCGGSQPLDFDTSKIVIFDEHKKALEQSKKPWYSRWWGILIIVILSLNVLNAVGRGCQNTNSGSVLDNYTVVESPPNSKVPTEPDPYRAGLGAGSLLGAQHSYYRGNTWIKNECTGFIMEYIGMPQNDMRAQMFIKGCINGYNQAFGK